MRAEKAIVADQWFFKAHFYQDPVQPGSLGLEALLQALGGEVFVDSNAALGISQQCGLAK